MTFRIALYGTGPEAQPYLRSLAQRRDVQLAGVCDPDTRSAELVAAGWGASVCPTWEALLEDPCPDALWVCVPAAQQSRILLRAAERRIPFFVHFPGASEFALAQSCDRLVREARLVTAVGFHTTFIDVVREAREYLGGNPVPLALGWWLRPSADPGASIEGLLWNEGCQLIDALRFFCGPIQQVQAFGQGGGRILHLSFSDERVAVVTLTTFARPAPRVQIELLGEGWTLGFDEDFASLRVEEPDRTTLLRRLNHPVDEHVSSFLEAVASGDPSALPSAYSESFQTLSVCHAAECSFREKRLMNLAEIGS